MTTPRKLHYTSIMDHKLLSDMLNEEYVSRSDHPFLKLMIYNYTAKAVVERVWNPATLQCRGLILDEAGYIVARPFPKFFNLEEYEGTEEFFGWNFKTFEKYDGSLGVLYFDPEDLSSTVDIATRGSFVSDQAQAGFYTMWKKYWEWSHPAPYELTYLFEIIDPTSRVVVDYKGVSDLVLLAVVDNHTGQSVDLNSLDGPFAWPGPVAYPQELPDHISAHQVLQHMKSVRQNPNVEEGYVMLFSCTDDSKVREVRVKAKYEDYVALHRIVTGLSNKFVWECLSMGQTLSEIAEYVPDEFHTWLRSVAEDLQRRHDIFIQRIQEEYTMASNYVKSRYQMEVTNLGFRRHFAKFVQEHVDNELQPGMFLYLDGNNDALDGLAWKRSKPTIFERAAAFNVEEES